MPINISGITILQTMANIPLIPAAQQTYSRFKRRRGKPPVDFDDSSDKAAKRSLKHRLGDRRKLNLRVRLDRRYNLDRRHRHLDTQTSQDEKKNTPSMGRHINTTA